MKRTFLGNVSSLFVVMAILLSAIATPAMAAASTGTVTRSFSSTNVAPGATITVTITPAPAATFASPGYQVVETVPAGFTVTANTAGIGTNVGNVYTFTNIGSGAFTYTVTAPAAAGTGTFSGTFKDQDQNTGTVGGTTTVTVSVAPPPPPAGAQVVSGPCAVDATKTCFTSAKLRIIDENTPAGQAAIAAGPSWDAQSFYGFWYDLDDGLSSETLNITVTNLGNAQRTIPDRDTKPGGGLVYESTRQLKRYEVAKNKGIGVEDGLKCGDSETLNVVKCTLAANKVTGTGSPGGVGGGLYYGKLGWMAEEFVAVNGKAKKLSKLLIEQKEAASEKKTLTVGETWTIGDYTLTANSIDAKASPRQVWLTLNWKGQKIDDKVLGQGEVYTYIEKNIAGESDVPMFVTYIDSVFAGATTDMVQLRFTWAASRDVQEVKESDIIGVFKAVSLTDAQLHLENDASVDLSRDSTVTLAKNFVFKVADDKDNKLRFEPAVLYTQPGTYTERGFVVDQGAAPGQNLANELPFTWSAQSYSGFWYDLDDGLTSETLTIFQPDLGNSQRTIQDRDTRPGGGLVYESARQLKRYEVAKNKGIGVEDGLKCGDDETLNVVLCTLPANKVTGTGTLGNGGLYYGKLGWMSEEFVAVNGKAKKLSKLLIEQKEAASEKKTLTVGETWTIGDYTLTANSIDAKASPRQVWLTLNWKGQKIDDKVLGQGQVYTYIEKNIAGESDVPMFVTYIDSVFAGATTDMVQLRFTWAASRDIQEIKESDIIGVFKAVSLTDAKLHLENDASVDLSRDSQVTLSGNFKFAVADDKDNNLRFYPMVLRTIGEGGVAVPTTPAMTTPGVPIPGTPKPPTNMTPAATTPAVTPAVVETTKPATPVPTPTKKEPGFESVFAIAGLLAVAYLVLRQRK